jgi:hypothetical protein
LAAADTGAVEVEQSEVAGSAVEGAGRETTCLLAVGVAAGVLRPHPDYQAAQKQEQSHRLFIFIEIQKAPHLLPTSNFQTPTITNHRLQKSDPTGTEAPKGILVWNGQIEMGPILEKVTGGGVYEPRDN